MKTSQTTEIYNYRYVDDALATSGQPSEEQLKSIAEDQFNVIINLALNDDPRYSLADESGLVNSLDMEYVHIPVQFNDPKEEELLKFFDAMEAHKGKNIFVHCAANMRVSVFIGLYRKLQLGMTDKDAFPLMKSIWEPDEIWSTFITKIIEKY